MTFTLADQPADIATALRELEAQDRKLSPTAKSLMILAASMLEDRRKLLEDTASELSAVNNIRVGMMDSQSRADDVAKHIKQVLTSLDSRIRDHLTTPVSLPPPLKVPSVNSTVI